MGLPVFSVALESNPNQYVKPYANDYKYLIVEPRFNQLPISASNRLPVESTGSVIPAGLYNGGETTEVELVDTEWRPLPPVALANRNAIAIQNYSGIEIKVRYTDTGGYSGMRIVNLGERFYNITDDIIVYGRSSSGTITVDVEELS
jgi:hypothetical protein